jgi:hypothetical protein
MAFRVGQPNFSRGEIGPKLRARFDTQAYQSACATLRNMVILKEGGVTKRVGMQIVARAYSQDPTKPVRLIPFTYSIVQAYVLEMGQNYMRPLAEGGAVLYSAKAISGISQSSHALVNAIGHGLSVGDQLYFSDIGGMTRLNKRIATVLTVPNANSVTIDIDTTLFSAFTSGGTLAKLVRVSSPYAASELSEVDAEQSADTLFLAHLDHPPTKLVRSSPTSWSFNTITFGPVIGGPTTVTATAFINNTDAPNDGDNYYPQDAAYQVCAINDNSGQQSRPSPYDTATNDLALKGNYNQISWNAVPGATRYAVFKQSNSNNMFGYIGVSGGLTFQDNLGGITPDYTDVPAPGANPFSGSGDYPSTVTLHQQRLVWGRTRNKPNGVYFSQTADLENMDVSIPTKADDAITYAIVTRSVNPVNQLASMPNGLLALTGDALFTVTGAQGPDDPITPTSINVKPGVSRGASRLDPIVLDSVAFYTTEQGGYVRSVGYSFELDGSKSDNVSIFSPHFFDGFSIVSMAYAEFPLSCIWAVRNDGALLCFTWEQEQSVWGWSLCETDGEVESVAVISEEGESRVYLSVWRTINGTPVRFIERMASALTTNVPDTCYLDCSITDVFDTPQTAVPALGDLEGQAVMALADGSVVGPLTVSGGQITLPSAASTVAVGLPYTATLETLPLVFQGQGGLNAGKRQMLGKAVLDVLNTRGIMAGPSLDKLLPVKPRGGEAYGNPNAPMNGYIDLDDIQPSWNAQQSLSLTFPHPLPATVLSAFLEPVISADG